MFRMLALFRMGGKKAPPTNFSSVTSAIVGISAKNLLTFSFNPYKIEVMLTSLTEMLDRVTKLWSMTTFTL